jgi:hypothetical protein
LQQGGIPNKIKKTFNKTEAKKMVKKKEYYFFPPRERKDREKKRGE